MAHGMACSAHWRPQPLSTTSCPPGGRTTPTGVWGHAVETSGRLSYQSTDDTEDLDYFPRVGVTSDGTALYDLTGRVWVTADSDQ